MIWIDQYRTAVIAGTGYIYVTSAGSSSNGLAICGFDGAALFIVGFLPASSWGGDNPRSVSVAGDYAYITDFSLRAFIVVNVSDPTNPTYVTKITDTTNWNQLWGLDVVGNYAYVTARSSDRLSIIDITTPSSPSVVGTVSNATTLNGANEVRVGGNYAYVTCGFSDDRFTVVDISNPAAPAIVGSTTHTTNLDAPFGIEVVGSTAYVLAQFSDRLTTLDVSNPAAPAIAGSVSGGTNMDEPSRLVIVGNYAYVASTQSTNTLAVVDISNPAAPAYVTNRLGASSPFGIGYGSSHVFLSDFSADGLYAYNINTPAAPVLVDNITDPRLEDAGDIYVTSGPFSPPVVTPTATVIDYLRDTTDLAQAHDLAINSTGTHLFTGAYGTSKFTSVNVTDPTNIAVEQSVATPALFGEGVYVDYAGGYVALSDFLGRLQIWNVSNPAAMVGMGAIGTLGFGSQGRYPTFFNGSNYVAWGYSGNVTRVINATNKAALAVAGSDYAWMDPYLRNSPHNGVLYLNQPLRAVNVSNPVALTSLGTWAGGNVVGAIFHGNSVYVAKGTDGVLHHLDISTPGTFTTVATVTAPTTIQILCGAWPWAMSITSAGGTGTVRPIYLPTMTYGASVTLPWTADVTSFQGAHGVCFGNHFFIARRKDCSITVVQVA